MSLQSSLEVRVHDFFLLYREIAISCWKSERFYKLLEIVLQLETLSLSDRQGTYLFDRLLLNTFKYEDT